MLTWDGEDVLCKLGECCELACSTSPPLNGTAFVEVLSLKSKELLELALHTVGCTPSSCEVAEEVQSG
jgi:hypothetical protein